MQIKVTTESPDILNHEVMAMGLFSDERPPQGICGLVDWRLNGLISKEIVRGHILGTFMEKILIPTCSRIPTPKIFLIGLGLLTELTADRLSLAGYHLSEAMEDMHCNDFAFTIPIAGRCHLSVPDMTEAMMTGCFNHVSQDIEKWVSFSTSIVVPESCLEDVMTGLENFKRNTRDVSVIEIA
jgi:hypothetical protein